MSTGAFSANFCLSLVGNRQPSSFMQETEKNCKSSKSQSTFDRASVACFSGMKADLLVVEDLA